jgi:hypothetical protein
VKRFAFIVLFAGFPLRVSKMERSTVPGLIYNMLSLGDVYLNEKVYSLREEVE